MTAIIGARIFANGFKNAAATESARAIAKLSTNPLSARKSVAAISTYVALSLKSAPSPSKVFPIEGMSRSLPVCAAVIAHSAKMSASEKIG